MNEVRPVTMVATLGGQPQIITFALDALLAAGVSVRELVIVHLADPAGRTKQSLDCLAAEFVDDLYQGQPLRYRLYPIRPGRMVLADIYYERDAEICWQEVNRLIEGLKNGQKILHICISGGRRMLGLLTMSAAMLHFGREDVLWHMYTPADLRSRANEGGIMHLPSDSGFRLIEVPMLPWGSYFPGLRGGVTRPENGDVLAEPRALLDNVEREQCATVFGHLTSRQQEVLGYLAEGLTPQQVAERMEIGLKTVDTYKTAIFAECRNMWGKLRPGRVDYHWLANKFRPYFAQHTTKRKG